MRKLLKNLLAFSVGSALSILMLEGFLHFYHPFPVQVKQNDIVLPANRAFTFQNTHIKKLDKLITCTKNEIGFRGKNLPEDEKDYLSIIAVGGSTTECRLLNDGQDWPAQIYTRLENQWPNKAIWMNNAGIDGHSTFGHLILLDHYLCDLNPDVILFLTGINEMGRDDLFSEDQAIVSSRSFSVTDWIKKNSETFILANTLYRSYQSYKIDLGHGNLDLWEPSNADILPAVSDSLSIVHSPYLSAYKKRLSLLIEKSKKCGAMPILITQPLLFGEGIDDPTGADLRKVKTKFFNGQTYWCLLEQYNDVTRELAWQSNVPLIDLARWMPKNSLYFYDSMHFTNEGSLVVAEIIVEELSQLISKNNW